MTTGRPCKISNLDDALRNEVREMLLIGEPVKTVHEMLTQNNVKISPTSVRRYAKNHVVGWEKKNEKNKEEKKISKKQTKKLTVSDLEKIAELQLFENQKKITKEQNKEPFSLEEICEKALRFLGETFTNLANVTNYKNELYSKGETKLPIDEMNLLLKLLQTMNSIPKFKEYLENTVLKHYNQVLTKEDFENLETIFWSQQYIDTLLPQDKRFLKHA